MLIFSISLTVALSILAIAYHLVLTRAKQPGFNRAIILSIYIAALFAIPATVLFNHNPSQTGDVNAAIEAGVPVMTVAPDYATHFLDDAVRWIVWIYRGGVAVMTLRLFMSLWGIMYLAATGRNEKRGVFTVIYHDRDNMVPFSWGRWVFLPATTAPDEIETILAHECAHLSHRHWIDLILAEAVTIIDWYNPVAWMLRQDLLDQHEYQADAEVIATGADATEYQLFLIKKTVGNRFHALANSLNHSSLNKRITMMLSKKPGRGAQVRALAIVPAAALAIFCLSTPLMASLNGTFSTAETVTEVSESKVNENLPKQPTDSDEIYNVVDQVPEFPGGYGALYSLLAKIVVYPESAMKEGKQGNVVVRFVVDKNGTIQDPTILRSIDPALDAEALRAVKSIDVKFIPGKLADGKAVSVYFALPISFKLSDDNDSKTE